MFSEYTFFYGACYGGIWFVFWYDKRINCAFFTYTYFVIGKAKSTRGNTMMQIFVSDKGFVYIVPIKYRGDSHLDLKMFAK